MSASLYFKATRSKALTLPEQQAIQSLEAKYAVEEALLRYANTGEGPNWDSWGAYETRMFSGLDVVYEGATRLPDNSEDAIWTGMKHWCGLLAEIRQLIRDAQWSVHVEDHDLVWDSIRGEYDISQ